MFSNWLSQGHQRPPQSAAPVVRQQIRLETLEERTVPTVNLILDFDGGALDRNAGYATVQSAPSFLSGFAGLPGGDRESQVNGIVEIVRRNYSGFDVNVIRDDLGVNSPSFSTSNGDTVLMIIGDDPSFVSSGGGGVILGIAPFDSGQRPSNSTSGGTDPGFGGFDPGFGGFDPGFGGFDPGIGGSGSSSDVGFAFANQVPLLISDPTQQLNLLASTVSHESGHTFGLPHATSADSVQRQMMGDINVPQNLDLPSRFSSEALSWEDGRTISERDRLIETLGTNGQPFEQDQPPIAVDPPSDPIGPIFDPASDPGSSSSLDPQLSQINSLIVANLAQVFAQPIPPGTGILGANINAIGDANGDGYLDVSAIIILSAGRGRVTVVNVVFDGLSPSGGLIGAPTIITVPTSRAGGVIAQLNASSSSSLAPVPPSASFNPGTGGSTTTPPSDAPTDPGDGTGTGTTTDPGSGTGTPTGVFPDVRGTYTGTFNNVALGRLEANPVTGQLISVDIGEVSGQVSLVVENQTGIDSIESGGVGTISGTVSFAGIGPNGETISGTFTQDIVLDNQQPIQIVINSPTGELSPKVPVQGGPGLTFNVFFNPSGTIGGSIAGMTGNTEGSTTWEGGFSGQRS